MRKTGWSRESSDQFERSNSTRAMYCDNSACASAALSADTMAATPFSVFCKSKSSLNGRLLTELEG